MPLSNQTVDFLSGSIISAAAATTVIFGVYFISGCQAKENEGNKVLELKKLELEIARVERDKSASELQKRIIQTKDGWEIIPKPINQNESEQKK